MSSLATHKVNRSQPEAGPYEKLKLMILDGEIAGGEPLVERTLAERLGVSRTPVRETIFRLQREGLVRVIEGKGAFVASYTIEDMIEIYHVREGLEPLAARLSCSNLADEDLDHHETQLNRYRARPALRQEDPGKWRRLGRDFHNMFIHASKNARLIGVIPDRAVPRTRAYYQSAHRSEKRGRRTCGNPACVAGPQPTARGKSGARAFAERTALPAGSSASATLTGTGREWDSVPA